MVYGGLPENKDDISSRGKRKRGSEEPMDVEETPYTLLRSQVPSLSKVLLNQLKSSKTPPAVLQAGFSLLTSLLTVLPGSLTIQIPLIVSTCRSVLLQSPTTSTSTLHITCLTFLGLFFSTHPPVIYQSSLPALTPLLLQSLGERHPRVASESFKVFSALLNATKPVKSADWIAPLYDQILARLSSHDTDTEVRACAEDCMGDVWIAATDFARSKGRKEWDYICRTTGKTETAVTVVNKVARFAKVGDDWVNGCVTWLMGILRKSGRLGKVEVFKALDVLLKRRDLGSGFPLTTLTFFAAAMNPVYPPNFPRRSHHKSRHLSPFLIYRFFPRRYPHFLFSSSSRQLALSPKWSMAFWARSTILHILLLSLALLWRAFSGSIHP